MATYYWGNGGTSGTGTWNTSSATNWWLDATRLVPAVVAPTSADNVVIDSNSGTGTITCTGAVCDDLTVTATQAITLGATGSTLSVYGSLSFPSGGSFAVTTSSFTLTFAATSSGKTITGNDKTFRTVVFNGSGGGWTLGSDFTSSLTITLTNGSLDTANYNVTCTALAYSATGTASLTLGTSTVTLTGTGTIWSFGTTTGLTFSGASSTIVSNSTSVSLRTFSGSGLTYGTITIGGGSSTSIFSLNTTGSITNFSSTRTAAFTVQLASNITVTNWNISGSAGNVVTVASSSAGVARTLNITNRTSGIDYLDVQGVSAPLAPVVFYAGANTKLRSNVLGVAAIAPTTDEYIYVLASGTSWTVPANWNNSNNEIHLFGGGGGGASSRYSSPNGAGGGGGGGGGYTKATNVTLSGTISYSIGAAGTSASGSNGTSGGSTTFNSGAYSAGGGGGGSATTTSSTGGTGGTGSTYNGGTGGQGSLTTVTAAAANGGGGGGGAAGPLGAGANGGNGFAGGATQANAAGGGGGGNGGGSSGGNASSATGGTGGNNASGVGGGASLTLGFNGGGGGGGVNATGGASSSCGIDIAKAGMGSAGGCGGQTNITPNATTANQGFFGAGGGGGGSSVGSTIRAGTSGTQGGIVIVYSAGSTPTNYSLDGANGSYGITGQNATFSLTKAYSLSCDYGIYEIAGQDADLVYQEAPVFVVESKGGLPKAKSTKKYKEESELRAELEKIVKDEFDKLDGTYKPEAIEVAKQEVMPQIKQIEKIDLTKYDIAISQINALLLQVKIRAAEYEAELDDEEALLMLL